jgi:hypothetical protein
VNVSVDRIGEGVAVLVLQKEPRERITVPVAILPPGCREGDILVLTLDRDPAATRAAGKRVLGLLENLKEKN